MAIHETTLDKLDHFVLHPVGEESSTFTGATTNIADLKDYSGEIQILLDSGAAAASGTMTAKVQHSHTTTAGDFVDVTDGGFTAVAQEASKQTLTLNRNDLRRYIRLVATIADSGTTTFSCNGYGLPKYG